jgi:outer membrane protein assembly factor BamB
MPARSGRTLTLFTLALIAAVGCGTVSPYANPMTPGREAAAPLIFEIDWWKELVPSQWEFSPAEAASPAVELDPEKGAVLRVITATRDGIVRATGPDGQAQWSFRGGGVFNAGPAVNGGRLYVPGGDGKLYALKSSDGTSVWTFDAGEELATTPVVQGGLVLVASLGDTLFAVDAAQGDLRWQYRRDPPTGFTIRGASAPMVAGSEVYAGFADGTIVSLNLEDGTPRWERLLSESRTAFPDVDTTPVLDDAGRLYAASYGQGLFALSPADGQLRWQQGLQGVTSMLSRGPVLFVAGDQGLSAVLAETGHAAWTMPTPERAARRPLLARGTLLVPTGNGLLFVDPTSGERRLTWNPGRGVTATPAYAGGRVYVLSNLGYLYALKLVGKG